LKINNLLWLAITVFLFAACKRNKLLDEPSVSNEEAALEYTKDSIAYTIDGVSYNQSKFFSYNGSGNREPHSKIDSIVNYNYYISGLQDSVLYSRNYAIYNAHRSVEVIFIKTYNKDAMMQAFLWRPKDMMNLFTVGSRNYVLDYGRDNIQNGIALKISDGFKTYGSDSFRMPPQLNPDAQKDSKFEITSLRKLSSGNYILEAKFNALVFNDNNERKKLENGYLRLVISHIDLLP